MAYTLGSLFDGSGGFPLAGTLCGIEPKWAAEVEPYPIAVTCSRFPKMKHFGDVSKINGAEIEPVDIITFGSPCQDLSVAGKRAGLKHEANGDDETTRSGLFMEAVRIIKEMREATDGKYPSFALWENVPGAFSSNKGEDFRIVCVELIKIVEPRAVMPEVPQNGWAYADCYIGDGWSLAYRVFDAQYWGVPQRRRRIHLVLDLRGERAREVLFEREGLRGYFETGRTPWQSLTADAEGGSGADDREGTAGGRGLDAVAYTLKIRSGCEGGGKGALIQEDKSATLATNNDQYLFQPIPSTQNQSGPAIVEALPFDTTQVTSPQNGSNPKWGDPCHPLAAQGHPPTAVCILDSIGGQAERGWEGDVAPCLKASHFKFPPVITQAAGFCTEHSAKARGVGFQEEVAPTLRAGVTPAVCYDARGNGDGDTVNTLTGDHNNRITDYSSVVVEPKPVYCLQGNGIDRADTAGCNGKGWKEDASYTLNTVDRPAVAFQTYQKVAGPLMANSHPGSYTGQDAFSDMLVAGVDCRNMTEHPELYPTLQAKPNGGQSLNFSGAVRTQYIVRRLTPTECARLQGFADRWGWIEPKDNLTDEEYFFWRDVRNTHAVINGREEKGYSKTQMLNWYNKLWTDSAEYKMWGKGIALPTALYCLQGMSIALNAEEDETWMN